MEKVSLSEWLEVMQSGSKEVGNPHRMSWAAQVDDKIVRNNNQVNTKTPIITIDQVDDI